MTAAVERSDFAGAKIATQFGFFASVTGGRKLTLDNAGELNKKADEIKPVDGKIVVTSGGAQAYQAGGLMYLTGNPVNINGAGSVEITGGTITLKGNVVITGDLTVEQKTDIKGDLTVKGKTDITGNLTVKGTINDK